MGLTFPGESTEYRAARDALLQKEIELRRQQEAVVARRRALPPGGPLKEDYVFDIMTDGKPAKIKLSELFRPGTKSLITYNFMFPRFPGDPRKAPKHGEMAKLKKEDTPCPSCTAVIDSLDGAAQHIEAVVANAAIDRLRAFARDRGWKHARLISSAGNTFKLDYNSQKFGGQEPVTTVFHRNSDGIRHFWTSEMIYEKPEPGQDHRANGTIDDIWNMMDLAPEGRPTNFKIQLQYD
jgi:predicted dithiol-disulfide oxidoreductase (DUF899 family)